MKVKIFLLAAIIFLANLQTTLAAIEITDERANADYWISRIMDGDKILMTAAEIENFNSEIREKDDYAKDLSAQEEVAYKEDIIARIKKATDDVNEKGTPEVLANRNLDVLTVDIAVRYGVTVERGNIRILPQNLSGDPYDNLQATAIDPAEAVAILHESKDGKFYFVQSRNYFGWINKMNVALTDKKTWLSYIKPENFLVVTANKKAVEVYGKKTLFQMGAKIPLVREENNFYIARLPINQDGYLREVEVQITKDDTVNKKFLPCTPNNFIKQAFKFLGDEYGWGGLNDSVDCSAFVGDVYRSMGIEIPRDSDRQEGVLPIFAVFNDVTHDERIDIVKRAPTSSLLFKPGHVMMKLGNDAAGTPIVIHSASSYFEDGKKIYIRKVLVSELYFKNSAGIATIDGLTGIAFVKRD